MGFALSGIPRISRPESPDSIPLPALWRWPCANSVLNRVVYGSDVGGRSFASQLAKVIGAEIPDSAKELVLGGNLRRLFAPILRAKGYQA